MSNFQRGFTYIELMIVILILSGLVLMGIVSYGNIRERSYDQRRKTDLEEIRSALEQYRSVHNAYPTPTGVQGLPFGNGSLSEGTNTYMEYIPQDPQSPSRQYFYSTSSDDYLLSTQLIEPEDTPCSVPPGGNSCGTGYGCNYCLGSYGKK